MEKKPLNRCTNLELLVVHIWFCLKPLKTQHDNLLQESGVSNFWDNGTQGNYWSDYQGQGTYVIDQNNIDHHPLTQQVNNSSIAPTLLFATLPMVIIAIVAVVVALVASFLLYRRHPPKSSYLFLFSLSNF